MLEKAVWDDLLASDFVFERHFTSLHTLRENGVQIRQRLMGSELDLHHFARSVIKDHVTSMIKKLYESPKLRAKFPLKGLIRLENHATHSALKGK